jgi:PadR family transcriptional regulator PadR
MNTTRIRLTTPTRLVLDILMAAGDEPPWGYRICELAGLGSGTVYPILERLEEAGWIEGTWEADQPGDRPRRRFYAITGTGRVSYAAALAGRPALRWRLLAGQDPA